MYIFIDSNFRLILISNPSDNTIQVPRKIRLGTIYKLGYKNYFSIDIQ